MNRNKFLFKWILYSSLGVLLGFGFAALTGFLVASIAGYDENLLQLNPVIPVISMIIAGFAEGYILGIIQAIPLHQSLPQISGKSWALRTAAGSAVAWGVGMTLGPILSERYFSHFGVLSVIVGLLFLVILAGILGVAQWTLLRKHFKDAWIWIGYTILGWGIGLVFSFSGTGMIEENTPIAITITISLLSGLLVGAVSSFFTGLYLRKKLAEQE